MPTARRRLIGVAASLLLAATGLPPRPAAAATVLELQLDGLTIPIDLQQLQAWSEAPNRSDNDLAIWLNLLEPRSRLNLVRLLRAPLLRDRSFGQQLLGSWTGEQLLNEVGELLHQGATGSSRAASANELRRTVDVLLARRGELSSLDLLRALPGERVSLQLDGVLELAQQWQQQLQLQQRAWRRLAELDLPRRRASPLTLSLLGSSQPRLQRLTVEHRHEPLPLQLWPAQGQPQRTWVVLMPGLGGNGDQLSWLASALASWGWPVLVIEHPGSDEAAVKASLQGHRPPPGAESLRARSDDVLAVLAAQRRGDLGALGVAPGAPVVLMGHSLGGLTALLVAGQRPERGLAQRCRQALKRLPLTNLSRLLQCQLSDSGRAGGNNPATTAPNGTPIAAVVAFNGFGSLLWPHGGLRQLGHPLLLVGGSLDLITPPLSEQLDVFVSQRHGRSRLALIEGASHFSPVRVGGGGSAVFQLGDDLVGVDPLKVQALLLQLIVEFLKGLDEPLLLSPQIRESDGVRAHVLDPGLARRWQQLLRTPDGGPAPPPAHRRPL